MYYSSSARLLKFSTLRTTLMETSSWSGQVQLGFAAAGGADSVSLSKKRSGWVWHAAARVGNAYKPCWERRRRRRRRTQGGCSFEAPKMRLCLFCFSADTQYRRSGRRRIEENHDQNGLWVHSRAPPTPHHPIMAPSSHQHLSPLTFPSSHRTAGAS